MRSVIPTDVLSVLYNCQTRKFIQTFKQLITELNFLLIASQVWPTGINRGEKSTNLTEHLPGFSLIKEPHDDPCVLALHQDAKAKTQHCLVTSVAAI